MFSLFRIQRSVRSFFTFNAVTEGAAQRMIGDMVSSEGHAFNRHPEDYTLFEVGTFDDVSGELVGTGLRSVFNLASLT